MAYHNHAAEGLAVHLRELTLDKIQVNFAS